MSNPSAHSTPAGSPSPPQEYPLIAAAGDENATGELEVSTRFMEGYELIRPISPGGEIALFQNAAGRLDIYSVRVDGQVIRLRPDSGAEGGWLEQELGIAATQLSLLAPQDGLDSADNPLIFGLDPKGKLTMSRWDAASLSYRQEQIAPPDDPRAVREIHAARSFSDIYLNVLLEDDEVATNFLNADGTWSSRTWVPIEGPDGGEPAKAKSIAVVKNNPQDISLFAIGLDDEVLFADFAGRFSSFVRLGFIKAVDLVVVEDAERLVNVLAVDSNLNVQWKREKKYHTGSGTVFEDWQVIDPRADAPKITEVRPQINAEGLLELFAIGQDGLLYHSRQIADSRGRVTGWSALFPLGNPVPNALFAIGRDGDDYSEAYSVTTEGDLYHFFQDPETTRWISRRVELQEDAEMKSVPSHSVELRFFDHSGVPKANTTVTVTPSTLSVVRINGRYYRGSAYAPIQLPTNEAAMLAVTLNASGLTAPTLAVYAPFMKNGEAVTIEPNAALQEKLHGTTKQDVLDAKGADGEHLLKGEYRTDENAESLAKIMQKSMSLGMKAGPASAALPYLSGRNPSTVGLRHIPRASGSPFAIDHSQVEEQHWEVDFSSGFPAYRDLERDEAAAFFEEGRSVMAAHDEALKSIFDWTWGDIWQAIKNGVAAIVDGIKKFVISTIVDPISGLIKEIKVAFNFVIGEVKIFIEDTIKFFQQAFDIVEGIWNKIKVFFEDLYNWLAFLFKWDDIERTAEVIEHAINTTLDFTADGVVALRDQVKAQFEKFKGEIDDGVNKFLAGIDDNQPIAQYGKGMAPPQPEVRAATKHNVLLNAFVDNKDKVEVVGGSGSGTTLLLADGSLSAEGDGIIQGFVDEMKKLADDFQFGDAKQAYDESIAYFEQVGSQPGNVKNLLIGGIVKMAEAAGLVLLDVVEGTTLALLDLTADLIRLIKELLNETWQIPIVSQLYQLITGKELGFRPLHLVALVMAVPATLTYKVVYGKAPYPDQKSVDDFKAFFTVDWLQRVTGFGGSKLAVTEEELAAMSTASMVFGAFAAALLELRTVLETIQIALISTGVGSPLGINAADVLARLGSTIFTMPWIGRKSVGSLQGWTWGLQLIFGPLVRGLGFVAVQRYTKSTWEAVSKTGIPDWILSAWGLVHLIMSAVRIGQDPGKGTADASEILGTICPQLLRFATFSKFPYQPIWGGALLILTDLTYLVMVILFLAGDGSAEEGNELPRLQPAYA